MTFKADFGHFGPQEGIIEATMWVLKLLDGAPSCLFIIQVGPNAN